MDRVLPRLIEWLNEREYRHQAIRSYRRSAWLYKAGIQLTMPPRIWDNTTDTSHYSVRRPSGNTYIYAPWNWTETKLQFKLNIAKASQGVGTDPFYDEQVSTMKLAGVLFASYSYFDPSVNPINAAQVYAGKVAFSGWGRYVVVDCERRPATMSYNVYLANLGSFLHELEKLAPTGMEIIIYSRSSFWNPIWVGGGSPSWTSRYKQWVAIYPYDNLSSSEFDAICNAILHNGFVPPLPAPMKGLGLMVGWQWTEKLKNLLIPGHNMVKMVEDGDLWLASELAVVVPPPIPAPISSLVMEVLASSLNIRSQPNANSPVIGSLTRGERIEVVNADGTDAWVAHMLSGAVGWSKVKTNGVYLLTKVQ